MKKVRTYVATFIIAIMGAFVVLPVASVAAEGALDGVCANNQNTGVCQENANAENKNTNNLVGDLVNVLLFVIGALSVIMIIIGGILYVTSGGNSSSVTKAKNTILYAIVGLVVSLLAYAIVNWVVKLF